MIRISKTAVGVLGGLVIAVAGGLWAYQHRPLTVAVVEPDRDVTIKVFGLGSVEARVLAKIGFKVSGTLTDLRADHGDRVKVGQMLALVANSEQAAKLAKAKAQLESANAALKVAEAAAHKAEALLTRRVQTNTRRQALLARQSVSVESAEEAEVNEGVAKADLLVAQSEIESVKAKVDDARAQYEYERVLLAQHELRAPFDGTIVQRAKELGSVLAAGEPLFTLVAPETVWLLAYIDEGRAGHIKLGQPAEIRLRSLPQLLFRGRVERIGIESDRVNEERRVYVVCENCPEAFFLGEQAEVFITTAKLASALMVPEAAIEKYNGSQGVIWTVESGTLRRRTAPFGHRSLDSRIEMTGDLPRDAAIVAAVSADFREGRSVRIQRGPPK